QHKTLRRYHAVLLTGYPRCLKEICQEVPVSQRQQPALREDLTSLDRERWRACGRDFDYEDAGYEAADLIKMDFLLSGRPVEELATIVHKDKAYSAGKARCERLKESIPRQMFEIAVQAAIGSKIITRENGTM
uniref:GTP binding elongation factor GUF1 n=1 Tax=Cyprinus carpio carpio TaxID=630221 RepID=A0A9J7YDW0_CYPCA